MVLFSLHTAMNRYNNQYSILDPGKWIKVLKGKSSEMELEMIADMDEDLEIVEWNSRGYAPSLPCAAEILHNCSAASVVLN